MAPNVVFALFEQTLSKKNQNSKVKKEALPTTARGRQVAIALGMY